MIASSFFTVLNVAELLLHYREEDANLLSCGREDLEI